MGYRKVIRTVGVSVATVACLFSACSLPPPTEPPERQAAQPALTQSQRSAFLNRAEVRAYITEVSEEYRLDPNRLANLFAQIRSQQTVLDAISRPAEKVLTWAQYRPIFIKQKRIEAGREFMLEHGATLLRAEQEFGVPAKIIAAIIGVETYYGGNIGKHGVLEALATLAFDYPPRAKFFRSELTEFLVLSQSENWDTVAVKGSYAGAMGWPQFISSSYRHYAIDFDNDGKRDLFNSVADVIGSVANYLNKHGWAPGMPIAELLPVPSNEGAAIKSLQRKSLKPEVETATLNALGFNVDGTNPVSVMNMQGKGGDEVWVGVGGLYKLLRHNSLQSQFDVRAGCLSAW